MADDIKLILREFEKVNLRMDGLQADLKGEINGLQADLRGEINDLQADLKSEINDLRVDLNGEINDLRVDLKGEINDLRVEMNGKISNLQDSNTRIQCEMNEINGKISGLQNANTKIQLLIENDLSKKIDLIGEGHDFLKMKLDEALQMEKKWESMGLELINLRMDVNKLKDHVSIA